VIFSFLDPEDEKNMVFGNIVIYLAIDMMLLSGRLALANDFSSSLCFVPLYNDVPCDNI
jgi:uncharacterized protein YejL (UPF0352 family)